MSERARTYWAVWFANLIAAVGMMSFIPFFPSVIEDLGVTDRGDVMLWAGACQGGAPLMAALMGPLWGALGDRFSRKLMVVRSLGALALFVGLMSLARSPLELLALRMMQGVFSGFLPPSITLVSVGVPKDRQGRLAGNLQTAMAAGAIVGPLLGGYLVPTYGVDSMFAAVSIFTGLGTLIVALFAVEQRTAAELEAKAARGAQSASGLAPVFQSLARDLAALWINPRTRAMLILLFVTQFGIGATNPQLELYVRDLVGIASKTPPEELTGFVFTAMAVTNVIAMPIWGRVGDRVGHLRALTLAAVWSAVALLLNAVAPDYPTMVATRIALSSGGAAIGPCAFALVAAEAVEHRRGASFGAVFSSRTFAMASSATLGGFIAQAITIRGLFAVAGAALGIAGIVAAWIWSRNRR
ncbi:MAG: MFS transporter [Planctomycetota bacterium]